MTKELEALEFICKILKEKGIDIKWIFKNDYNTIKQALIKAQEQEKVLEIIKEKGVNVGEFEKELDWDKFDYKFYLCYYKKYSLEELTQEEFELLKRYFENGN